MLDDICRWRDVVKFPNLDEFDWEGLAEKQLRGIDRNETPVEYQSWNAQFLRLTHLMGFENALCAMYEEPEECYALMDAVTDYKIEIVKKAAKYFKPDFFTIPAASARISSATISTKEPFAGHRRSR